MQQDITTIQEARSFVGRNGPQYAKLYATKEEKLRFEGILYHKGKPINSLIATLASPTN